MLVFYVSWDDEIPSICKNKKWQPNHQPVVLSLQWKPNWYLCFGRNQRVDCRCPFNRFQQIETIAAFPDRSSSAQTERASKVFMCLPQLSSSSQPFALRRWQAPTLCIGFPGRSGSIDDGFLESFFLLDQSSTVELRLFLNLGS